MVKIEKNKQIKEVQTGNNYFMLFALIPTLGLIPLIIYGIIYKRMQTVISLYLSIFIAVFMGGVINGVFMAMGAVPSKSMMVNLLLFAVTYSYIKKSNVWYLQRMIKKEYQIVDNKELEKEIASIEKPFFIY